MPMRHNVTYVSAANVVFRDAVLEAERIGLRQAPCLLRVIEPVLHCEHETALPARYVEHRHTDLVKQEERISATRTS